MWTYRDTFLAAYAECGIYDGMICFQEFALLGDSSGRADAFDGAEWGLIAFILDYEGFFQELWLLSIPPTRGGFFKSCGSFLYPLPEGVSINTITDP